MPFLVIAMAAAGLEWVSTSTATRPPSISCWKRRSTAEPPERNMSTVMPVFSLNMLLIFCPVATGVEVYQTTLPSALALAMSTAVLAPGPGVKATSAAAQSIHFSLSIVLSH